MATSVQQTSMMFDQNIQTIKSKDLKLESRLLYNPQNISATSKKEATKNRVISIVTAVALSILVATSLVLCFLFCKIALPVVLLVGGVGLPIIVGKVWSKHMNRARAADAVKKEALATAESYHKLNALSKTEFDAKVVELLEEAPSAESQAACKEIRNDDSAMRALIPILIDIEENRAAIAKLAPKLAELKTKLPDEIAKYSPRFDPTDTAATPPTNDELATIIRETVELSRITNTIDTLDKTICDLKVQTAWLIAISQNPLNTALHTNTYINLQNCGITDAARDIIKTEGRAGRSANAAYYSNVVPTGNKRTWTTVEIRQTSILDLSKQMFTTA
ncbi:MAG: hypothetical protein MRY21_01965 [Simkaniaceae bacterium]|nr:hypothetical protein [Simkaniaceae bacterium]